MAKKEAAKGVRNISITETLQKAEPKTVELRKTKDSALKAEAYVSNLIATHNVPRNVINYLVKVLPKIIQDSEIMKQMSLHHHTQSFLYSGPKKVHSFPLAL